MSKTKKSNIQFVIQAIKSEPKLSIQHAAKEYHIPRSILTHRMAGRTARQDTHPNCKRLTKIKEEVLVQYILDWDSRGYSLVLKDVKDMANSLLRDRGGGTKRMRQNVVSEEDNPLTTRQRSSLNSVPGLVWAT
jgi:hypothetical protein